MAATTVIYLLWGATIGVAATTTMKALLTEHPLSRTVQPTRRPTGH